MAVAAFSYKSKHQATALERRSIGALK
uniref:Uncharacterized protein n=1 Tax=Physcomitrium patens TaxID=3218 RepID=A0A2K1IBX5_PHYPA|nr:hypothetical protein PHYPA_030247 [Physcomitrium patens]